MTTKKKTALELAQEHWSWLQSVLDKQRDMERKLFIDAFVHGYKHGRGEEMIVCASCGTKFEPPRTNKIGARTNCPSCGATFTRVDSTTFAKANIIRPSIRPSWDEYFIRIAEDIAARATCLRAEVGAVIVRDNRILSTGYNGSPPGEPHCLDAGCLMVNGHCERTVHAETNAVVAAAKFGIPVDGATLYFWDSMSRSADSCTKCFQVMKMAGIKTVIDRQGRRIEL